MVSTDIKMAEVDTEPSSDYYEKHLQKRAVTKEILQILCMSFSDKCFVNVIMPQIYSLIRELYYLVSKLTLKVVICLSTTKQTNQTWLHILHH